MSHHYDGGAQGRTDLLQPRPTVGLLWSSEARTSAVEIVMGGSALLETGIILPTIFMGGGALLERYHSPNNIKIVVFVDYFHSGFNVPLY